MPLIFLRAFPWAVTVVPASQIGDGTQYPVESGIFPTHDIYWQTKRLSISGSVSGDQGPDGNALVSVETLEDQPDRASSPAALIDPTGANTQGAGISNDQEFEAIAFFGFSPSSGGIENDFRHQHLAMSCSGVLRLILSGTFEDMAFSSIRRDDVPDVHIGSCTFEGLSIPLYAFLASGWSMDVGLEVTRIPFAL